jgi:hypothetical protein
LFFDAQLVELSDSGIASGIFVVEDPPRGQAIPVSRETVTAFIGPAPRGPIDMPVAVRSVDEYLARFGAAGHRSRLELLLQQYFENGGKAALVVRVARSRRRNRIVLPGPAGPLLLDAVNPGPLEHLRAAVDLDGVTEPDRFNLTVHRCTSPETPLVEEQESFANVSVLPGQNDFVGDALATSRLVRLGGGPPGAPPLRTQRGDANHTADYVFCHAEWTGADAPTDYDLIGSREEGTGLFALEQAPCVDLVCLVPGVPGESLGPVALFAAERYVAQRQAMLILDPSNEWTSVTEVVRTQRARRFPSPNALTYFPMLEHRPNTDLPDLLSACGAIAGLLAAGDQRAGPWALPAETAALALGRGRPAVSLDEIQVAQLRRLGVNAITRPMPLRAELHGAVTLARFGGVTNSWNDLRVRRAALFILGSIARYTRWGVFEQPDSGLWKELRAQVDEFLSAVHARGGLAGERARDAFYVKCDADNNDPHGQVGGTLDISIGLALEHPGQFVPFHIRHTARETAVEELGWPPGLALAG